MKRKRERAGLPRKYQFKLYPKEAQAEALHIQARMCSELWNALLQRQEDTYRRTRGQRGVMHSEGKAHLSEYDLGYEISALLAEIPEWRALSTWTPRRVAASLAQAFASFFSRAKKGAGAQAGYPRYKALRFADAVPHRFQSGCKLLPAPRERSDDAQNTDSARERQKEWRLALKGVPGVIRARGEFPGDVLDWNYADVIFRDGSWWLIAGVELAPRRSAGTDKITVSFDLIDEFARVERAEGQRMACVESARTRSQSPNHLDNLAGGPDADENAGSDVRDRSRFRIGCALLASSTDENASEDMRDAPMRLAQRNGVTSAAENAGEDVRDEHLMQAGQKPQASADGNAGSDVRDLGYRKPRGRKGTGTDGNAGQDVRAHRSYAVSDLRGPEGPINDRLRQSAQLTERADAIKSERDRRYRARRGPLKPSWRWLRETERAARLTAKAARIRRESMHEWSTAIVACASDLTVIAPPIKDGTKSPRGNEREWGASVDTVSKLNREILNKAPALAKQMLVYKAQESGIGLNVIEDKEPGLAIGEKLVAAGKKLRKAKRALRKQA